jgi:hypothetical protein
MDLTGVILRAKRFLPVNPADGSAFPRWRGDVGKASFGTLLAKVIRPVVGVTAFSPVFNCCLQSCSPGVLPTELPGRFSSVFAGTLR